MLVARIVTEDARGAGERPRVRAALGGEGPVDGHGAVVGVHRHPRLRKAEPDVVLVHAEARDADIAAVERHQIDERLRRRLAHQARGLVEPLADVLLADPRVHRREQEDVLGMEVLADLLQDPLALRLVVDARDHRVDAAVVRPVGDAGVEAVGAGDVGVHVGGDVETGGAGGLDAADHFLHPPPVGAAGDLEVPHLDRDLRLARDGEGLVERLADLLRLAADVARVEAVVARGHFRQRDQLRRLGEAARLVDEAGRDAERALLHRSLDQRLHPGQLLFVGLHVLHPQHGAAHLRRADQHRLVDAGPRSSQPAEVAGQIGPVDGQPVLLQPVGALVNPGGVHRRGRDALSGQLGGDALADLALLARVDQRVQLALAEQIDEARRDREVVQLEAALRFCAREIAHRCDAVAADADVGAEPGRPGAVDDAAAGEDQIEGRAEKQDHGAPLGATTMTPSSPWAPSTTARTASARRAMVASSSRGEVTSLVV